MAVLSDKNYINGQEVKDVKLLLPSVWIPCAAGTVRSQSGQWPHFKVK